MNLSVEVLRKVIEISEEKDMPIQMDYYRRSFEGPLEKRVFIGVRKKEGMNDEKMLIKSEEEYTSPIKNMYKIQNEYIILTENTIYIVSNQIKGRPIK